MTFRNETKKMPNTRNEKIIVALDVASAPEAVRLAETLSPYVSFFKIGLQLFTAAGPAVVREVSKMGGKVFLDLKLHDIPNTVAGAIKSISDLGVQMTTIHLAGGSEMVRAAVKANRKDMTLLGVTVLTSMDDQGLHEVGIGTGAGQQVDRMAALGINLGLTGLVTSPREVAQLRAHYGNKIVLVVPGIRPESVDASDQKRIMTPADAIAAGADYIVIGRAITAHSDPAAAVRQIIDDMAEKHAVV